MGCGNILVIEKGDRVRRGVVQSREEMRVLGKRNKKCTPPKKMCLRRIDWFWAAAVGPWPIYRRTTEFPATVWLKK